MTLFEDIKQDLSNFPDEVIEDWLLPFANDIKWPPKHQRWEGILFGRTVEFWQVKKWKKQDIDLSEIIFSQNTIEIFNGLYEAYILGQDNLYIREIKNGQLRFQKALLYLLKNGKFPKPIYLLSEQNQYSIVDGNHRFIAWHTALKMAEEIAIARKKEEHEQIKKFQERWKIKSIAHVSAKQEVWIAY